MDKYQNYLNTAKYSSLVLTFLVIPLLALFFANLSGDYPNLQAIYTVLYYAYSLCLLLYVIGYVLVGKQHSISSLIYVPILFLLSNSVFLLPELISGFLGGTLTYFLIIGDIVFVLLGISLLTNSNKFSIFKRMGYIAIAQGFVSAISYFFMFVYSVDQLPSILNLFILLMLVTSAILLCTFYFFQYKFFSKLVQ